VARSNAYCAAWALAHQLPVFELTNCRSVARSQPAMPSFLRQGQNSHFTAASDLLGGDPMVFRRCRQIEDWRLP